MNKEHDEKQQIAFYCALPSGSLAVVSHDPAHQATARCH